MNLQVALSLANRCPMHKVYFVFPVLGYGHVEAYTVEPGSKLRFSPEFWIGLPQLDDDLLKKILPVFFGIAIQPTDFIDHPLVRLD